MSNHAKNLTGGLFWTFLERMGNQGVNLIISIILARLIAPEEYGVIAAVQIFISIATVFVTGGFSSALIQKKDADDLDYSSMFYFNAAFSAFLYGVIYFSAPFLVRLLNASYDYALLVRVLRVLGVGIVFASFNSFYRSRLLRALQFKKTFFITLIGTLISAVFGIYLAVKGYGVWALAVQNVMSYLINSVLLVAFSKWIPKFMFSWNRLKKLLSYGGKLTFSMLLTTGYVEFNGMLIGNRFDVSALAFYKKGLNFPKLIVGNIMSAINSVLFPVMSRIESKEETASLVKKFNRLSVFVIAPMMLGFAAVAPAFIETLLGAKWLPAVPFLQLACFDYALQPIGISNLEFWKADGRATLYLVTDVAKKTISISLTVASVLIFKNVIVISVCQIIFTVLATIITLFPQKKLLGYSMFEQLKDVFPQYFLSVLMFAVVYAFGRIFNLSSVLELIFQIILGVGLYAGLAVAFKMKELHELLKLLKRNRT